LESGIKRTQRDYSLAFKLSVVEQVEKGEMSYREAQRRFGIQGASTVLTWLRRHGHQDWSVGRTARDRGLTMEKPGKLPLTPEQRIRELEEQLKQATQKAQLFEAVVDVLKKDYGVQLVKKPSGRSSRKRSSKD
jgi:transposase-like protein